MLACETGVRRCGPTESQGPKGSAVVVLKLAANLQEATASAEWKTQETVPQSVCCTLQEPHENGAMMATL